MARPVRTSNLLKETAADHENLDRMEAQERWAVNRAATQPPVQENESVIEKAEEKEPSVQEKLDAILPDDFFCRGMVLPPHGCRDVEPSVHGLLYNQLSCFSICTNNCNFHHDYLHF